jgi:hypothetical protein
MLLPDRKDPSCSTGCYYLIGWIQAVPEAACQNDQRLVDQVDDPILYWDISLGIRETNFLLLIASAGLSIFGVSYNAKGSFFEDFSYSNRSNL